MHPDTSASAASTGHAGPLRSLTHAMYAMHLLSWVSLGLLSVLAMVLHHLKRGALPDRFYRSHFRWQARSFWFTLLWLLVTAPLLLLFVFAGYIAWLAVGLWYLYRFIRGWWAFAEHRPMPMPADP
ncbi:MAG: hypothetical protein JNL30_10425 [Rubrivivax sp.]|nr:hypothetical protein [Rubrivivax sp.]